jgi:hypothetical protein
MQSVFEQRTSGSQKEIFIFVIASIQVLELTLLAPTPLELSLFALTIVALPLLELTPLAPTPLELILFAFTILALSLLAPTPLELICTHHTTGTLHTVTQPTGAHGTGTHHAFSYDV